MPSAPLDREGQRIFRDAKADTAGRTLDADLVDQHGRIETRATPGPLARIAPTRP
ncbi:MAG TPA: hypothetical protein VFE18_02110 [Phenylobacterium sp.]|jgi:hypothetical protein|nr:hypothetical protein [Phenylobacterium sp.]